MKQIKLIIFFILLPILLFSQKKYTAPLDIKVYLSANFGELRNNHFHAGLDYKTEGVSNKPIYAVNDGYISRISVSPSGYGLALYINHPDGHTSVYAHMNKFNKEIAEYVKKKQYELESYKVNLFPKENELPIKRGEQIGLSGNTGGSGGPHLHFEMRDTKSEEPIDPLNFFENGFTDTVKPELNAIAFYPQFNSGVINGSNNPKYLAVSKAKSGNYLPIKQTITAWGKIGIGVKAYDRMNNTRNIYGVKKIELYLDNILIYRSNMNRFSYSHTRILNSFIDFQQWREHHSFYMKSFVEPGNKLQMYDTINFENGIINITQERTYKLKYILKDHFGNTTTYHFDIKGSKQSIPQKSCGKKMVWNLSNYHFEQGFSLTIPQGNLYTDICYHHNKTVSSNYFSDIHQVNTTPIPLHKSATIWLALKTNNIKDVGQYGIIKIDRKGRKKWLGGKFKNGGIETTINELGERYTIDIDTDKPTITPIASQNWVKNRKIRISLKDNYSGIATFRGTIDGNFALFTHDTKSDIYTYYFDTERLEKNKNHTLVFMAKDNAGNDVSYSYQFYY